MAIETERCRTLLLVNCMMASAPLAVFAGVGMLLHLLQLHRPYWAEDSLAESIGIGGLYVGCALLGSWTAQWLLLRFLTRIEVLGLRAFSRARGTRITRDVAVAIASHATVGWIVAGIMITGGLALGLALGEIPTHRNVGPFRGTLMLAWIWMPATLGLLGLLTFEIIVYAGMLNCKFANRTQTTKDSQGAGGTSCPLPTSSTPPLRE